MGASANGDLSEVIARGAVEVHVAPGLQGKHLDRGEHAEWIDEVAMHEVEGTTSVAARLALTQAPLGNDDIGLAGLNGCRGE